MIFYPLFSAQLISLYFWQIYAIGISKKIGLYSTAPYSIFSWWWWWCSPIFDYMRDMSHVSKHQWHRNQLAPAIEHPSRLNRRLERVQKTVVELEGERISGFYTIVERTGATHPKKRFWVPNNRTPLIRNDINHNLLNLELKFKSLKNLYPSRFIV